MSDNIRPVDRDLAALDELDESWGPRTPPTDEERLARDNQRTRLLDDHGHLTTFAADVLEFERSWWKFPAAKEAEVRRRWDIAPTRYYQLVNALVDMPEAYAHDPMTVKRLDRLRTARRDARTATPPSPDTGSELF